MVTLCRSAADAHKIDYYDSEKCRINESGKRTPLSEASAPVDTEWDKLKNLPAWHESLVRNKQKITEEAQNYVKTVHVATLLDLCHLRMQK